MIKIRIKIIAVFFLFAFSFFNSEAQTIRSYIIDYKSNPATLYITGRGNYAVRVSNVILSKTEKNNTQNVSIYLKGYSPLNELGYYDTLINLDVRQPFNLNVIVIQDTCKYIDKISTLANLKLNWTEILQNNSSFLGIKSTNLLGGKNSNFSFTYKTATRQIKINKLSKSAKIDQVKIYEMHIINLEDMTTEELPISTEDVVPFGRSLFLKKKYIILAKTNMGNLVKPLNIE
jgi:hypothetical protein